MIRSKGYEMTKYLKITSTYLKVFLVATLVFHVPVEGYAISTGAISSPTVPIDTNITLTPNSTSSTSGAGGAETSAGAEGGSGGYKENAYNQALADCMKYQDEYKVAEAGMNGARTSTINQVKTGEASLTTGSGETISSTKATGDFAKIGASCEVNFSKAQAGSAPFLTGASCTKCNPKVVLTGDGALENPIGNRTTLCTDKVTSNCVSEEDIIKYEEWARLQSELTANMEVCSAAAAAAMAEMAVQAAQCSAISKNGLDAFEKFKGMDKGIRIAGKGGSGTNDAKKLWNWVKENPIKTTVGVGLVGGLIGGYVMYKKKEEKDAEKEINKEQKRLADIAKERGILLEKDGSKVNCLSRYGSEDMRCSEVLDYFCSKPERNGEAACYAYTNTKCAGADGSSNFCFAQAALRFCNEKGGENSPSCKWINTRPKSCLTKANSPECLYQGTDASLSADCAKMPDDPVCQRKSSGLVASQPGEVYSVPRAVAGSSSLDSFVSGDSGARRNMMADTNSTLQELCRSKQLYCE